MIVTPLFTYVHVPRTAGNFLRQAIHEHFEVLWESDDAHARYQDLPEELRQKPAIVFVRNPWDWYVSEWSFGRKQQTTFEDHIRQVTRRWRPRLRRHGLYSPLFDEISEGAEVRRYERLGPELREFLEQHEVPTSDDFLAYIASAPRVNASERESYDAFYTDETRQLVQEECRSMIERFDYRFEVRSASDVRS